MPTTYAHTNLVAGDWRKLAAFYQAVFDCTPLTPERDLSGKWLDTALNLKGARIRGIHLRLPGYGDHGPTLEIFQYDAMPAPRPKAPDTPGFSHIAFAVEDVAATAETALSKGAAPVGELTLREVPGVGQLTFVYLADPEGNIIEIQNWE